MLLELLAAVYDRVALIVVTVVTSAAGYVADHALLFGPALAVALITGGVTYVSSARASKAADRCTCSKAWH